MSETCPKCGSNKTNFEGQCSWDCGTYQPLIGGSRIRNPQSKLIVGAHCKDRQTLAKMSFAAGELKAELAAEKSLREAAEARTEGLLQHLQHLVDDLDQMCPDSIWSGWWEKALALLAPAPEQEGGGE